MGLDLHKLAWQRINDALAIGLASVFLLSLDAGAQTPTPTKTPTQSQAQRETVTQTPLAGNPAGSGAVQAAAASPCDMTPRAGETTQQEIARLIQALNDLPAQGSQASQQSPCWNQPLFLARLGHLLVKEGLYLDALDYLERAILLDPNLKDAQIDYALALSGSGDLRSGSAMLASLLKDPGVPVELAPSLLSAKGALERGLWRANGQAGLTLGYDSNLLGAPNLSGLALTVSGQTAVLPLAPTYLAKKGGYGQADVQYEAQKIDIDGSRSDFYGNVRQRLVPEYSDANFTQLNLVGEYGMPSSWGQAYVNYSLSGYQTYSESFYNANTVGAGGIFPIKGSCSIRLGINGSLRRYNTNTILNGNYFGAQGIVGCMQPVYWQLIANLGQDVATNVARPGGSQNQTNVRAISLLPAPVGKVLLDLQWASFNDLNGYSDLIDSGRSRIMTQYSAKAEYQYPLSKVWQAAIGYNWINQISTLELFAFNNSGPYIALRYGW